jgi:hypothetical protein
MTSPEPLNFMLDFAQEAPPPAPPTNRTGLSLVDRILEVDLIQDTLEALEEEGITPEISEMLTKELIAALAGTRDKIDRTCGVLAAFEAAAEAAQHEIDRLDKRKAHFVRQHGRLEAYALAALQLTNQKTLEGHTSKLSARLNPPSVIIDDSSRIPAEFMRTPTPPPPTPDKMAIKKALAANIPVPSCRIVRTYRLERA